MKVNSHKAEVLSQCCNAKAIILLDEEQKSNWACSKCKKFFETKLLFPPESAVSYLAALEEEVLIGVYGTKNKVKLLMKLYHLKKILF